MESTKIIKIGITQGDTNGVGYEVILGALEDPLVTDLFTPIIYGSRKLASFHKKALDKESIHFNYINKAEEAKSGKLNLIDACSDEINVEFGVPTKESGLAAYQSLEKAVQDLKAGVIDALVTAPINKDNIQSETFNFPGHTEYLASADGGEALMFMVSDKVNIAVVTGHIPISSVAENLSIGKIVAKLKIINQTLKNDFSIQKPKIAVLGLNPHAGDNGLLGKEDLEIIKPAIEKANQMDVFCQGPYPADGFFGNSGYLQFDAVLAMYHDQGLIPFKTIAFGEGTNFTAGLSFIRTSPDHGTGYDIAGKGVADSSSMLTAIFKAIDIAKNRKMNIELSSNKMIPTSKRKSERNA